MASSKSQSRQLGEQLGRAAARSPLKTLAVIAGVVAILYYVGPENRSRDIAATYSQNQQDIASWFLKVEPRSCAFGNQMFPNDTLSGSWKWLDASHESLEMSGVKHGTRWRVEAAVSRGRDKQVTAIAVHVLDVEPIYYGLRGVYSRM
jgi:hypothetical protein